MSVPGSPSRDDSAAADRADFYGQVGRCRRAWRIERRSALQRGRAADSTSLRRTLTPAPLDRSESARVRSVGPARKCAAAWHGPHERQACALPCRFWSAWRLARHCEYRARQLGRYRVAPRCWESGYGAPLRAVRLKRPAIEMPFFERIGIGAATRLSGTASEPFGAAGAGGCQGSRRSRRAASSVPTRAACE